MAEILKYMYEVRCGDLIWPSVTQRKWQTTVIEVENIICKPQQSLFHIQFLFTITLYSVDVTNTMSESCNYRCEPQQDTRKYTSVIIQWPKYVCLSDFQNIFYLYVSPSFVLFPTQLQSQTLLKFKHSLNIQSNSIKLARKLQQLTMNSTECSTSVICNVASLVLLMTVKKHLAEFHKTWPITMKSTVFSVWHP
jgi:hypothetical protein